MRIIGQRWAGGKVCVERARGDVGGAPLLVLETQWEEETYLRPSWSYRAGPWRSTAGVVKFRRRWWWWWCLEGGGSWCWVVVVFSGGDHLRFGAYFLLKIPP